MALLLPYELVDKCVDSRIWVKLRNQKEVVGELKHFDRNLHMILEDVTCYEPLNEGKLKITKLDQILLNGNKISVIVPGGTGPENAKIQTEKEYLEQEKMKKEKQMKEEKEKIEEEVNSTLQKTNENENINH
ncbi:u6 snRNA-associated sm-like protein lsm5 [Anaeramoeba flamelloides]|uniref:U6 snRNA-associated Sm-like protein LSm5 n=1 Tax=Anaeramoeba flamelloides TaxID=1746091 RepID=A0AAV7YNI1_9EUKA|nr:u6 snRNA-associated sm-like protein lsm5 [Anaeramoeba flamelloides]KAJ6234955.1 u6 snRNA-associated sm-like protein lsm5 [Anaeramoeba flamelloides]